MATALFNGRNELLASFIAAYGRVARERYGFKLAARAASAERLAIPNLV